MGLVGDSLYAVGGFDGALEVLSLVERLDMSKDLSKGEWQVEVS